MISGISRVALVTGAYFPTAGGAERQVHELARHLAGGGCSTFVLSGQREAGRLAGGVEYVECRLGLVDPIAGSRLVSRATECLIRIQPDIVVASLLNSAAIAGATYSHIYRRPLYVRLGGAGGRDRTEVEALSETVRGRAIIRYVLGSRRVTVITPAEHIERDVVARLPWMSGRVRTIPNGVAASHFLALETPYRDRPECAIWYTNGGEVKNAELFLSVVRSAPDLQFLAVGEVERLPNMPNLSKMGWIQSVSSLWNRCRVVLNTSHMEGAPNFVLQGLAGGCRAVGVSNPGMAELGRKWPGSVIVTEFDALSIADAIRHQMQDSTDLPIAAVPSLDASMAMWDSVLGGGASS